MSFSRRLAAGLPTVGAIALVALAIGGAPASAATEPLRLGHATVTPSPDTGDDRGNAGYGGTVQEAPDSLVAPDSGTADLTTPPATATVKVTPNAGPTRGRPGYQTSSTPSTPSTTTPGVPGGLSSATATPVPKATTAGAGLSNASNLPVTGMPIGGTLALGGLMLAAGSAAVWYTRRRRNA